MSIPNSIVSVSKNTFCLIVRAKPGAKKSNIVNIDDECIGVQIAAPPREGAANEELIDFISHILGVKPRCISLDSGSKNRNKTLMVTTEKLTAEDVFQKLNEAILNN